MSERKQDWEVVTGWEKRIAVDFGSIGPVHPRWSHWTWKERDIVARKVHESTFISKEHGPRSKAIQDWSAENAPIMIGFARDHGPMPDWAHAEHRPSGVPEHVQVVWQRERPDDPASPADWAYDPPGPWQPGKEPEWSSRPMEAGYDPNSNFAVPAEQAPMQEGFNVNDLVWDGDRLLLPISDIVYPAGKDELLGMVESKDPTRGGWVTMSALEALGSGADYTETVRNAKAINFVVSQSYSIEKHPEAVFKLYFRKANGGMQRPDYMEYAMAVPTVPGADTQEEGPVGLPQGDGMHSRYGSVITYRTAANGDHIANDGTVISTAESRAKEDVPDWRKFELGRLEDVDGVILPGPNALPQDEERYGGNRKFSKRFQAQAQERIRQQPPPQNPDRILPDDPAFTPLQKALSWSKETQHGQRHQQRWGMVAAALGADNGKVPMPLDEVEVLWERFGRNARWTMALNAIEEAEARNDQFANARQAMDDGTNGGITDIIDGPAPARDPIEDANRYRAAVGLPPVEKSQGEKLRDALLDVNEREDVVVREFNPATGTLDEISVTPAEAHQREMETYHNPVAMQGSFTAEQWWERYGCAPVVCYIEGQRQLTIYDPQSACPTWWLDGEGTPSEHWRHEGNGRLSYVGPFQPKEAPRDEGLADRAGGDPAGDAARRNPLPVLGAHGTVAAPPAPPAPPALPMQEESWAPRPPMASDGQVALVDPPQAISPTLADLTPADMANAIARGDWVTVAKIAMQKV